MTPTYKKVSLKIEILVVLSDFLLKKVFLTGLLRFAKGTTRSESDASGVPKGCLWHNFRFAKAPFEDVCHTVRERFGTKENF